MGSEWREVVGGTLVPRWWGCSFWQKLAVRVAWTSWNERLLKESNLRRSVLTVDQFVLNDNFFSDVVTVPVGMIVNRFVVERIIERFKPVARI